MSKWISEFLEKEPDISTDNTDKPHGERHLSVLSVPTQGDLDQNSGNIASSSTDTIYTK